MNMELFCGWELAYVFCLISGPHSHFKGRSTRGLDFLICLATESTTCMWDQLQTRADNSTASKCTPLPTSTLNPSSSSLLRCLSLSPQTTQPPPPVLPGHKVPHWVWSCNGSIPDWHQWAREGGVGRGGCRGCSVDLHSCHKAAACAFTGSCNASVTWRRR